MGNSTGNFKKYWDIVRRYPRPAGRLDLGLRRPGPQLAHPDAQAVHRDRARRAARRGHRPEPARSAATRASPAAPSSPATQGLDLTGSLTLEAWVTPQLTGYHQPIIAKGDTQYALKQSDRTWSSSSTAAASGSRANWALPDDWTGREHHVAGVFDAAAGTLTLHVDGEVRATRTTTRRPGNNTASLALATDVDNPTREFSGTIRRARVYARALSAAELASDSRGPGDDGVRFWFDAATVGLTEKRPREKTFYAYGGDWGDNPNDGAFAGDGIVTADRGRTGKAAEVKRIYQAVTRRPRARRRPGAVTLTNEYLFTNLREFDGRWELVADGKVVQRGRLTRAQLDVAPLSSKTITVPVRAAGRPGAGRGVLPRNCPSPPGRPRSGRRPASRWPGSSSPLDAAARAVTPVPLAGVPALPSRGRRRGRSPSRARASPSPSTRRPASSRSYKADGARLITSGPAPNFWRAPTDNDRGNGQHTRNQTWRDAGTDRKVTGVERARPARPGRRDQGQPAPCRRRTAVDVHHHLHRLRQR